MIREYTVAPYQGEFQSSSFPCFVSLFFEMFWTCECEFLFGIANRLNHWLVLTCLLGDSRSIFFCIFIAINFKNMPSVFCIFSYRIIILQNHGFRIISPLFIYFSRPDVYKLHDYMSIWLVTVKPFEAKLFGCDSAQPISYLWAMELYLIGTF